MMPGKDYVCRRETSMTQHQQQPYDSTLKALFREQITDILSHILPAEEYLQSHAVAMYPLLPTMHGANASILLQAIDEMVDNYEGEQLTNRLLWFQTLLGRVETVSVEDKDVVERRLNMFEELLEEDPHIQERVERVAQRRVEAELAAIQAAAEAKHARVETERARVEAEVRTLRQVILSIVQGRFPDLAEAAQPKLEQITEPKLLHNLAFQLSAAPDQTMARWVLETTRA